MLKTLVFISLSILIFSQPYPLYKQCDNEWGYQQMGISFYDLCDAGSVVCCLAMSSPNNYNPGTLNKWLKQNNKYVSGSTISMTSLDGIGLSYQGILLIKYRKDS